MIFAGLKLAVLGMTVVFFFLLLLVACIHLSCRFLTAETKKEIDQMNVAERKMQRRSQKQMDNGLLVAIMSGAIAAHRARMRLIR